MLKVRVLTAVLLLPIALLVLFIFPEDSFAFGVGLIVLIGAWEWIRLSGAVNRLITLNLLLILAGALSLVVFSTSDLRPDNLIYWLYFLGRGSDNGHCVSYE